jgi:hypothetical protein
MSALLLQKDCSSVFVGVRTYPNMAHSEARASAGNERIAATENAVESIHSNEAMHSRR